MKIIFYDEEGILEPEDKDDIPNFKTETEGMPELENPFDLRVFELNLQIKLTARGTSAQVQEVQDALDELIKPSEEIDFAEDIADLLYEHFDFGDGNYFTLRGELLSHDFVKLLK